MQAEYIQYKNVSWAPEKAFNKKNIFVMKMKVGTPN